MRSLSNASPRRLRYPPELGTCKLRKCTRLFSQGPPSNRDKYECSQVPKNQFVHSHGEHNVNVWEEIYSAEGVMRKAFALRVEWRRYSGGGSRRGPSGHCLLSFSGCLPTWHSTCSQLSAEMPGRSLSHCTSASSYTRWPLEASNSGQTRRVGIVHLHIKSIAICTYVWEQDYSEVHRP